MIYYHQSGVGGDGDARAADASGHGVDAGERERHGRARCEMDRAAVRDGRGVHHGVGERDGTACLDGHSGVRERAGELERPFVGERHGTSVGVVVPAVAEDFTDVCSVHGEADIVWRIADGEGVLAIDICDPAFRLAALHPEVEEITSVGEP